MPPASPMFFWNIRRTGSSTPCGTPTKPTVEPGPGDAERRLHRLVGADALEHGVRADSPGDLLDRRAALLAALGDDVGGAELAGDLLARLVPRHRDRPSRRPSPTRPARRTGRPRRRRRRPPYRPRGRRPRPRRASRSPSRRTASAATGSASSSGMPSVLTRLPSAWCTRAYSAWPLSVKPRLSHADCTPARQCGAGVVAVAERHDHEVAGPERRHLCPDLLDDADALVADRRARRRSSFSPRYGHRSEPQMQPATTLTMASVGRGDRRVGDVGDADVPRGVDGGGAHGAILAGPPIDAAERVDVALSHI